ncbi:PREDICTED: protein FAM136A [Ceratosolen solmsi marchali]|uniref:Protein FAM136A n=1 Tax=Ceratosolen solmsi marchali TaxID=326594 RepID=A0AAJ6YSE1_9HYME|nr:PREDICTED: protein FAM136A [Ceratosolen solmsi marchali]
MVDEQRKRIEDLMTKIIEDIDITYLRNMQGDMHRCAAICCDNKTYTVQKVYKCVENCSVLLNKAQRYVQNEFDRIQNRLQRCVMECNDEIKDKIGSNLAQSDIDKFSNEFEKCATTCVDTCCNVLPTFLNSIKNTLASETFDN